MNEIKIKYKKITKKDAITIFEILDKYYPDAVCGLNYSSAFELTLALILAAQCTDKRVNEILPLLLKKFDTPEKLKNADLIEIENIIKPCGFYKNKAKSIKETSRIIVDEFNSKVPDTMEKLCTLKGIGRKSSNIILQECFNKTEGIAVDTHVTRISRKIGLSNSPTPLSIEKDLLNIFEKKYWNKLNHILVVHGRAICIARRPKCDICPINKYCMKNE